MISVLDPVVLNDWFAVSTASRLKPGEHLFTRLLDHDIVVWRDATAQVQSADSSAWDGKAKGAYKMLERYGYLWVTLGEPQRELFELPEYGQPGRRTIDCGTFGVKTSGLRIIENFLDMAHFPYVHTNILGKEPHTEVREYKVETRDDVGEIWATECNFWQPKAAASASEGMLVEYSYRVVGPFAAILYKSNPLHVGERDVIALYVQPVSETESKARMSVLVFDDQHSDGELIAFQQTIFSQDKPILENQLPQKVPLDPRAEMPTRADAMSIAYRRRLRELGLRYGVQAAPRPV
ncbi:MAG: hypothetical protein OJF60_002580 [Burkholderiaceae bacterium]|nr:MAG: hypothetical protein OJF60_002580 [Burkholderiaceae bacterium]